MKTKVLVFILAIVVATACYLMFFQGATLPLEPPEDTEVRSYIAPKVAQNVPEAAAVIETNLDYSVMTNVTVMLESVEDMVAEERYPEALKLIRGLMKSDDPEVRKDVAFSLGWIGYRALPELSLMLQDVDGDVAESAYSQWSEIVNDLSDKTLSAQLVMAALRDVEHEYVVNSGVMLLDSSPAEIAVPALVDLIENGGVVASEIAREHYEFTTGEPYSSRAQAELWVKQNSSTANE